MPKIDDKPEVVDVIRQTVRDMEREGKSVDQIAEAVDEMVTAHNFALATGFFLSSRVAFNQPTTARGH